MAKFTIYSKDGLSVRHTGEPQYSGSYMGVDYVEFRSVSSPTPIDWQIGDYVDYYRTGKRYKLYSLPMPKKVARKGDYGASFEYSNVQLHGATKELEIAPFRDLVPKDNKIHFSTRPEVSTYEDVYGIARRIQECMDDIFPNRWRIEVYNTNDADMLALFGETKEYSVSNGSCLDALSQIYDTWKNVGWIHTYDSANEVDVITIGRANVRDAENTSDVFAHGIGKGLTSLKKASANEGEFATRLYVYGSERNIQTRYYNGQNILNKDSVDIRNLMLPIEKWGKTDGLPDARKAYLQADDSIIEKYGLIPRTVYFDGSQNEEIYPSIVGLTERRVRQAMINAGQSSSPNLPPDRDVRLDVVASVDFSKDYGDKTAVESNPTFKLYYGHLGFNLADQGRLTSEGYAVISMKTGACAGREFVVQSSEDTGDGYGLQYQIAVVKRTWDESLGMGFPNEIYPIKNGDEFVILDIPMPDYYITLAADDLLSAGEKMLADYTRVSAFYEPSVDAIKIKTGGKLLQAGMFMQVYDEDIIDTADNKDYVLIDTLTIDEKSGLPIYKVTLREQKRSARTYSALEDMIEDTKEVSRQEIRRERQYTDRRFRSAQETLKLLQAAFKNFSEGISPVTVRTMAMLVGDESLQFKFTAAYNSLTDVACPFSYDETTKQMKSTPACLKHMTLGIKEITTGTLSASSYMTWNIPAWASSVLEDGTKSYYVYVRASKSDSTSECLLSETPIDMEGVGGYYHFLVGILNAENGGTRDFVTLYGFTEVLPGQITTDVIRSASGKLVIDLVNAIIDAQEGATIRGKIAFGNGSSGLENLSEWSVKQKQIDDAVADIKTLQNQLDGVVESYFEKYAPSRENKPASDWIANGTEADHEGDTFTNTELSGDNAGKSWRWLKQENGIYDWQPIADSDAAKALAMAAQAQDTADGKRTTFVEKPNRAYQKGDIWIVGPDYIPSGFKQGDILNASQDSENYIELHWKKNVRYTDDSKADAAQELASSASTRLSNWASDRYISPVEKEGIREELRFVESDKATIVMELDQYGLISSNEYQDYMNAVDTYVADLNRILDDTRESVPVQDLLTYQEEFYAARTMIVSLIAETSKAYVDGVSQRVSDAEYLSNAMKNGQTIVDGGLVMSSMVAVANTEQSTQTDAEAFLNGSDFAEDPKHGKLILAGGIPEKTESGETDLELRAKEALTRIYEDGEIVTKNLTIEDGDITGNFIKAKGLFINATHYEDAPGYGSQIIGCQETGDDISNAANYVMIVCPMQESYTHDYGDGGGIYIANRDASVQMSLGTRGISTSYHTVIDKNNNVKKKFCYHTHYGLYLKANGSAPLATITGNRSGKESIRIESGYVSGLRPKTLTVTGNVELTKYDYTVFMNTSAYVYLPKEPEDGQKYEIFNPSGLGYINGNGKTIWFRGADYSGNFDPNGNGRLFIIYWNKDNDKWWMAAMD